jgi:hypothetical protein
VWPWVPLTFLDAPAAELKQVWSLYVAETQDRYEACLAPTHSKSMFTASSVFSRYEYGGRRDRTSAALKVHKDIWQGHVRCGIASEAGLRKLYFLARLRLLSVSLCSHLLWKGNPHRRYELSGRYYKASWRPVISKGLQAPLYIERLYSAPTAICETWT